MRWALWTVEPLLWENLFESRHGEAVGHNEVAQDVPGRYQELVDITDEDEAGMIGDRFQELVHQPCVDHARFVDDAEVALGGSRFLLNPPFWKSTSSRLPDRRGVSTGDLRGPLRGSPSVRRG